MWVIESFEFTSFLQIGQVNIYQKHGLKVPRPCLPTGRLLGRLFDRIVQTGRALSVGQDSVRRGFLQLLFEPRIFALLGRGVCQPK